MATLIALLIILGVWFFMIAPFLRLWRASKGWRDMYSQTRDRARRPADPEPPKKKKKIDPEVGEYVEFTETTTVRQTPDAPPTVEQEQQVTDVTWTDL